MTGDDGTLERMKQELDRWRTSFDALRVQARLGRMEARDRIREERERLGPVMRDARERLARLVEEGGAETRRVGESVLAGWNELQRKYSELGREDAD